MTTDQRAWRLAPKIGLIMASTLLGLALVESFVRVFDIGPTFQVVFREIYQLSDNPILEYELRPGAPDGNSSINSAGLRDREYALAKPPGVYRIVAIGDSVTYGPERSRGGAYPKQLEGLLNASSSESGARFEVLNLGVTGYNITQVVERLRVVGLAFDPDLILYGYVLNDPQAFSFEGQSLKDRHEIAERRLLAVPQGLEHLLARSRLFLLVRYLATTRDDTQSDQALPQRKDPGYTAVRAGDRRGMYFRTLHQEPEPKARLEEGWDSLERAAGAIPVVVSIFPLLFPPQEEGYSLADVHSEIALAARARGFGVVDLAPPLEAVCRGTARRRCLSDFMHLSPFGYGVVAKALFQHLADSANLPGIGGTVGTLGD